MATVHVAATRPKAVRSRSGDAGSAMFTEHREGAYRVAWRLLGEPQTALRIVAASFILTLRGGQKGEASDAFKTRLHRIMTGLVRKQPRAKRDSLAREKGGRMTTEQRMHRALRALPGQQREAFALAIDGELSYEQIAAVQGVSAEAAMLRVYRARRGLHELLTKPKKRR